MMARTNVLVVSDAHTAAVVRSALSPTCDCELVSSADAALASLGRGHVDVVVAEDGLDGTRGLDLFDALGARGAAVPFILLGAAGDAADPADARQRGIFDYLTK